jgi:hypothetical protein
MFILWFLSLGESFMQQISVQSISVARYMFSLPHTSKLKAALA